MLQENTPGSKNIVCCPGSLVCQSLSLLLCLTAVSASSRYLTTAASCSAFHKLLWTHWQGCRFLGFLHHNSNYAVSFDTCTSTTLYFPLHCMQALRKSLIDQKRIINAVPEAPVFYPTVEEFKNPLEYIGSIKKAGEAAGIVKIVPPPGMCCFIFGQMIRRMWLLDVSDTGLDPCMQSWATCLHAGWKPSFQLKQDSQTFPTKRQPLHKLQEGLPFDEVCCSTSVPAHAWYEIQYVQHSRHNMAWHAGRRVHTAELLPQSQCLQTRMAAKSS